MRLRLHPAFRAIVIGGMIACIFLVDAITPRGVADGMLYVLPVLATLWLRRLYSTTTVAVVCAVLILSGYFVSPGVGSLTVSLANRLAAVVVICVVAVVCLQRKRARAAVEQANVKWAAEAVALEAANDRLKREVSRREHVEQELRRSNDELQQFAYIASHDLQAPLRTVTSYLDLLQRRYGERLDDEAREFITEAVSGATDMRQLVEDLLQLARVNTRKKEPAPVDLNKVVQQVIQQLAEAISISEATITQDPLPTILADQRQMVQLFQNLIANSLKYRGSQRPVIHISSQQRGGEFIICVTDNGIGIDPKHTEDVFAIFRRLHNSHEYPGTGIGLAICRRIVQRHGGKIWLAESELGSGCKFCVRLPYDQMPMDHAAA